MATMTQAKEKVKRARAKPARSMRLSAPVHANGVRLLVLTVGKLPVGYYVEPLPADFGRGFKLTKFAEGGGDADETEYLVSVDTDTGNSECSCKGHAYAGHCKHADAQAALVAAHRL
jgi:hypothetical protein